eukprot:TRINITY_DN1069_c0_g1_i1.p1 TRINITY_DN1069_c0_g1~~TRINITY_DN1069_c0_g1_i1.p1  ORF type:complete len:677 (+),score=149.05 TRINITY_DN1069_c0_g1_i1:92-2122(+)
MGCVSSTNQFHEDPNLPQTETQYKNEIRYFEKEGLLIDSLIKKKDCSPDTLERLLTQLHTMCSERKANDLDHSSQNKFWAKGTGFGYGNLSTNGAVGLKLIKQRADLVAHSFKSLNTLLDMICKKNQQKIPSDIITIIDESCLVYILEWHLRNDSLLDVFNHNSLYTNLYTLIRKISSIEDLRFIIITKNEGIVNILALRMAESASEFLERLSKVNSSLSGSSLTSAKCLANHIRTCVDDLNQTRESNINHGTGQSQGTNQNHLRDQNQPQPISHQPIVQRSLLEGIVLESNTNLSTARIKHSAHAEESEELTDDSELHSNLNLPQVLQTETTNVNLDVDGDGDGDGNGNGNGNKVDDNGGNGKEDGENGDGGVNNSNNEDDVDNNNNNNNNNNKSHRNERSPSKALGLMLVSEEERRVYTERLSHLLFDSCDLSGAGGYEKHGFHSEIHNNKKPSSSKIMRLVLETSALSKALPISLESSIFVRTDDDRIDVMKALIIGPSDTPYAGGCFEFDIFFPNNYPHVPPLVKFLTTGNGSVRFNPNLYNNGKVCLSLLGTWSGGVGETWSDSSTLLQVLVSIQSLILVSEPYYNEPGVEAARGTKWASTQSEFYNNATRQHTVRHAVLGQLRNKDSVFSEVIQQHFRLRRDSVLAQASVWLGGESDTILDQLKKELDFS